MNKITGPLNKLWNELIGYAGDFDMENRAFNYVCVITFPILLIIGAFDLFIAQTFMTYVIIGLLAMLCVLYYYSRYKRMYHGGIIAYAVCSYMVLIANYYSNDGIDGPTLFLFFLTFHLLIAIGRPRLFPVWIALHIGSVIVLLYTEYTHPLWVPHSYKTRWDWFWDIGSTFVVSVAFVFGITNYLRRSFIGERRLARERLKAIRLQNEQIKEQNLMLERLNDEKNKLLSIISHDLKSPLDSIRGYLTLMSENLLDGEDKHKAEAELLERTKYTSDLLQNLLAWGKTQIDGVVAHLTPMSLNELLKQTMSNKQSPAAKKDITLSLTAMQQMNVLADRDMLHIVLRNLINNAIKFTPNGGAVSVSATAEGNKAVIAVRDNGIGIPEDKYEGMFSLKTGSTYGTNNEKGTGLGLMMCKEYMNYQHGAIWFDSKVGVGSVFYLSLPLADSK